MTGYCGRPNDFTDFLSQFVFARCPLPVGERWEVRSVGRWSVACHETLPLTSVITGDGTEVGWLLGHAIDSGGILRGSLCLDVDAAEAVDDGVVKRALYRFGGRYVCLVVAPGCRRLYLDPFGSLAVVYSSEARMAASTTSLLGAGELPLKAFPASRPNQFFPAGLTHELTMRRLLPNHVLDLETWEAHRHWPETPLEPVGDDEVEGLVGTIVARVGENVRGLAGAHRLLMGLTSGRDSRMVLACSRDSVEDITFVTFDYDRGTRLTAVDRYMARRLSRRFGLRHQVLSVGAISDQEKRSYWRRIGFAGGYGKGRDFDKASRLYGERAAMMNGFGGEVGRAFYWSRDDRADTQVGGENLRKRMSLDDRQEFSAALDAWIDGAPATCCYQILDLAYLEHRVGCWCSPHLYGGAQAYPFSPFCHREIVEAMLRLPVAYRRENRVAVDVVRRAWPEMADLPYHSFQGWRRCVERARNAPRAVGRRLRSLAKERRV